MVHIANCKPWLYHYDGMTGQQRIDIFQIHDNNTCIICCVHKMNVLKPYVFLIWNWQTFLMSFPLDIKAEKIVQKMSFHGKAPTM